MLLSCGVASMNRLREFEEISKAKEVEILKEQKTNEFEYTDELKGLKEVHSKLIIELQAPDEPQEESNIKQEKPKENEGLKMITMDSPKTETAITLKKRVNRI